MAEPENHTLRLLRELRDDIKTLDRKVDTVDSKINALDAKVDRNHEDVKERIDRLRQAMVGESILGRYATAKFEERLSAVERRFLDLEER
jgi:peptidoglycan hydrolase CwlO-like protein